MPAQFPLRRRRTALLVVLACTAALSFQALLAPRLWDSANDNSAIDYGDIIQDDARQLLLSSPMEEMEMIDQSHRILATLSMEEIFVKEDEEILSIPVEMGGSSENRKSSEDEPSSTTATANIIPHAQLIDANQPLPPYTMQDAIESSKLYEKNFALLVYDPDDNAFYGLYSKRHFWVTGCQKLVNSFKYLAFFLRTLFPERFRGKKSAELIIPISSGDFPGIKNTCYTHFRRASSDVSTFTPRDRKKFIASGQDCPSDNSAPILNFGSVFRHPNMFPTMIDMPVPTHEHLFAFGVWLSRKIISNRLSDELLFGEKIGLEWEDLIPQVVWRGTDFSYLSQAVPSLDKPQLEDSLTNLPPLRQLKQEDYATERIDKMAKKLERKTAFGAAKKTRILERVRKRALETAVIDEQIPATSTKAAVVESLKEQYMHYLPRWKAAVLTAEAEVNAEPDTLPWANMKFSTFIKDGSKASPSGSEEYKDWEEIGIATGGYMSPQTLSKYKYQIDLGGGGGTTWTGTIQKLAMPGLLFHHLTPTKDSIHDWMKPWVHYVPVSSDLLDLKQKFDWAESHPVESKQIADEGTNLMRYLSSPEGLEAMLQQDIVEPLRRVIEAYQPVSSTTHSQTSAGNWRVAIQEIVRDDELVPMMMCRGHSLYKKCEQMLDTKDMKNTFTRESSRTFGGSH